MGKPITLLEGLCGHALKLGAESIEVTFEDKRYWVFARTDGRGFGIANYPHSSADARELRQNLYAAARKSVRTVLDGRLSILNVRVYDSSGEDRFEVTISPAPRRDPSIMPSFTAKQGQYLCVGSA